MAPKKQAEAAEPEKEAVLYRFVGQPGDHVQGVPAKDLTRSELEALTPEQQALLGAHLRIKNPIFKLEGEKFEFAKMPAVQATRDWGKEGVE